MRVTGQCQLCRARQGSGAGLAVCARLCLREAVLGEQPRVQALGLGALGTSKHKLWEGAAGPRRC